MLLTIHLLVGAVIGKYINNVWLIVLLALISHYILDMIPHTSMSLLPGYKEKGLRGTKLKDLLIRSTEPAFGILLFIFFIFLYKERAILILIAGIFAFLPDIITFFIWKYDIIKFEPYFPRPGTIWYNKAKSIKFGIATQIIVGVLALIILLT